MADHSTCAPLTRASVCGARELISSFVHHTPTLTNATIDRLASTPASERDSTENPKPAPTTEGGEEGGNDSEGEGEGDEGEKEKKEKKTRKPANPRIRLYFKCENFQRIGAFKIRGAFHAIEKLKREPGWEAGSGWERGVVTHSSGEFSLFFSFHFSCILS
jgi:threonine dehydratase